MCDIVLNTMQVYSEKVSFNLTNSTKTTHCEENSHTWSTFDRIEYDTSALFESEALSRQLDHLCWEYTQEEGHWGLHVQSVLYTYEIEKA